MAFRAAAEGRRRLPLAAFCLLAALLISPTVEASRGLPAALAPALTSPSTPDQVLSAELEDPPERLRLFDDLRLPERPLELVGTRKTASGVSTWNLGLNRLQIGGLSQNRSGLSFQGLWHDPLTGIAYARNRWYDARTAHWLSPDPMGAFDSPNQYAFVAWGPHMATDPLGLTRYTEHGGANYLGDIMNEVELSGESPWYKVAGTILLDTVGNTVSDALWLDTIADAAIVGGDSTYSGEERLLAGAKGVGVTALNVSGGVIAKKAFGLFAKVPGVSRLAGAISQSRFGQSTGRVLGAEVPGLSFVDNAINRVGSSAPMSAMRNSSAGRFLSRDIRSFGPRGAGGAEGFSLFSRVGDRSRVFLEAQGIGRSAAARRASSSYFRSQGRTILGAGRRNTREVMIGERGFVERLELHHRFIPNRWRWVPNQIRHHRLNLKQVYSLEHALEDPFRYRFLPRWVKEAIESGGL